jgi:hypothetical protein
MRLRGRLAFLFVFLALASSASLAGPHPALPIPVHAPDTDPTWERLEEKDGVTVFLRRTPGSPIKEAIGKGVVDVPPCRVFQVLRDSDRLVEFMPYVKAHILKAAGADWENVCEYLDFPWPIWDRLVTVRVDRVSNCQDNGCEYFKFWRKDETFSCTIEEIREAYQDAVADPVVPPTNQGYWHLLSEDGGKKTLVYYYLLSDAGGTIPALVQNYFLHVAVRKLFNAVRERASDPDLYPPCQP